MEEAYSGENHRGGALEKAVHGEGLRRRRELRGGLEGASQKLGSGAKWVRGWMEELEAWWIGVWLTGSHEFGWKAESTGAARFCALGANGEGRRGMALWLGLREAEEVAARAPALSGVLGRGLERRGGVQR